MKNICEFAVLHYYSATAVGAPSAGRKVVMTSVRSRSLGAAFSAAVLGAAALTVLAPTGVRSLLAEVKLIDGEDLGFIMGGTGNPLPDGPYVTSVEALYLDHGAGYSYSGLETPEQFCPIECLPSQLPLGFDDSVNAGAGDLHNVVVPALNATDNVSVLGYSQSATVASQLMNQLIADDQTNLDHLHVTLLGDPNSAIGGILDRFQFPDGVGAFSVTPEPQHVPFLDIPVGLEQTPLTGIATDIYTGEYDGWADFPSDPSNIFADVNALIGIETVHPYYPDPTPGVNLDTNPQDIIDLGTIGQNTTHFYDIFAPLPTLAFLYDGGPAGLFFYDAASPFATLVDDWGYGNPGDPFVGVNGTDAIGPWQVDATGQLMASGIAGFIPKMDPLQMLAGVEYAAVHTFVDPIDALLQDAGQSPLPISFVDSLLSLSGYDVTNQLDASLLTAWTEATLSMPSLAPDAILDGSPLISAQPLIDLVGYGFDIFNFFGA
jgi:PE-PPE domain